MYDFADLYIDMKKDLYIYILEGYSIDRVKGSII